MLFGNGGSGGGDINVNTSIGIMYSDTASLGIGCWNDKLTLSFTPAIGKNEKGLSTYDKNLKVCTSISQAKINILLKKYEKKIQKKYEEHEDPGAEGINVGISIRSTKDGSTSILLLEYKDTEEGIPSMFLTIGRKMTDHGTTDDNIISFKFDKISVFENFNLKTGTYAESQEDADFEFFIDILRNHVLMTGLNSHATRYSNAFKKSDPILQQSQPDNFSGAMPVPSDFSVFS